MQTEAEALQLAATSLNDAVSGIDPLAHPNYVRTTLTGFRGHVREAIVAGAQLNADRAELRSKADLIPAAGAARLAGEALAEAETRSRAALNDARSTAAIIKRGALLGALPQVDAERELLARQELATIIGEGSPVQLATRVAKVAESGSRDAIGALLSSYGPALLEARGLAGRELADTLDSAKRIVVESALDNPSRHTESELKSAALYRATGGLDAAVGAASWALGHLGVGHA